VALKGSTSAAAARGVGAEATARIVATIPAVTRAQAGRSDGIAELRGIRIKESTARGGI
jgi:hypothetical protein